MTRSRPQSLRSLVFLFPVAVAACGPGSPPQSVGSSTLRDNAASISDDQVRRVAGANDPARDIAAVQEAVNSSRKVRLVGTFDFGATGRVVINDDVEISGQPGAVIKGGLSSFASPLPATLPPQKPGPAISIQHLTFDGAHQAPIDIEYARSVDVSYNRISNVRPVSYALPPEIAAQNPLSVNLQTIQEGIKLGSFSSLYTEPIKALTGSVMVRYNDLDLSVSPGEATGNMCEGIVMMRGWGVAATFSHNAIVGCSRNAIEVIDNSKDEGGRGSVEISNTRIDLPAAGLAYPTISRPNGIIAGWYNAVSEEGAANIPHRITNNVIAGGGSFSLGIFANSPGVLIKNNHVTVRGVSTNGTYGIMVISPDGDVRNNAVEGSGRMAFALYKLLPTVSPDGNTLRCNDASGYAPAVADLYIMGNGNTVIGFDGSIIDLGTGTTFVDVGCEDGGTE